MPRLTILALGAAFVAAMAAFAESPATPRTIRPFELPTPGGERLKVDPAAQRLLVVDFFATWCVPCIKALPELNALAKEYTSQGLKVVGVDIGPEEAARVEKFVTRRKLSFPVVLEEPTKLTDFGEISSIPHTFLIDHNGTVAIEVKGHDAEGRLREAIAARLGKPGAGS